MTQKIQTSQYVSPIGPLTLVTSEVGLLSLIFAVEDAADPIHLTSWLNKHLGKSWTLDPIGMPSDNPYIQLTFKELDAYFKGEAIAFTAPKHFLGTAFQKSVWETIDSIPYGHTLSYKDIATQIGCPKGSQAVGQATGKNPLPIIVPCHRVLGQSGAMTGFSAPGGIDTKRQLLQIEHLLL